MVATSSDELRRLVEAFNRMAADLQRQRGELERTNRLAAWADMARQVAHDIKNPLTPIQLNAEHLQRVHADRGRPLGAVVDDCVANILGAGAAAPPDLVGVLELRLVAASRTRRRPTSPRWSTRSSIRTGRAWPAASPFDVDLPGSCRSLRSIGCWSAAP